MKILFVASEMSPYVKTGGLADVVGSLPNALRKKKLDVRVLIPYYKKHISNSVTKINDSNVYFLKGDVPVYLLENDSYFSREKLYGYEDDCTRFGFFVKAAIESLNYIDFMPDVIHFHDWQTALGCLFLKRMFPQIKSVFTIHNLQYQGVCNKIELHRLGIGDEYYTPDKLEFYGNVNYMKAGILYSNVITTVSNTYAKEIQTYQYGYGLDGTLRNKHKKIFGIVNGVDYKINNPMTNTNLYSNYSRELFFDKCVNKKRLQKALGLCVKNIPVVSMISRFADQKGFDLVYQTLEQILSRNIQLIILGNGDEHYERMFCEAEQRFSNLKVNLMFNEKLAARIYAGSDIFLMPSKFEPCGLAQLIAMRYGAIPVVRNTGGLADTVQHFNCMTQKGNGFVFNDYNVDGLMWGLNTAIDIYESDKVSWNKLIYNAMSSNFSWGNSAKKYISIYKALQ